MAMFHKMLRCTTITAFRQARKALTGTVAFVPTMGALHEGHLSLVRQAQRECDYVVASIFVNPTQFSANEDLDKYPRPLQSDLAKLESEGVWAAFLPSEAEMYGHPGKPGTVVEVQEISQILEGKVRPHFFRGVATIVCKLLNVVQPDILLMGQKDGQQSVVVRNMIEDLKIDTALHIHPTMRECDGLALSSRNAYLSPQERLLAPTLYRALQKAQKALEQGERRCCVLKDIVKDTVEAAGSTTLQLQYVSVNDTDTLIEMDWIGPDCEAMLSAAMLCGQTRLIDNIILQPSVLHLKPKQTNS